MNRQSSEDNPATPTRSADAASDEPGAAPEPAPPSDPTPSSGSGRAGPPRPRLKARPAGDAATAAVAAVPEPAAVAAVPEPAAPTPTPAEEAKPEPQAAPPAPSDGEAAKTADGGRTASPAGPIRISVFGRTDVGQIREHNEDNFIIADLSHKIRVTPNGVTSIDLGDGGVLMAVCDGMGGAAAGEVASRLATDIIFDRMSSTAGQRDRDRLAVDLIEALEQAGQRILFEANNNRSCRGMGTTATVAALVDDHLLLGQVGDSRAYILRGERLVQVTRDQSLVNQLIEIGQLTQEEAENFEHSNIILQALGTAEAVQVDLTFVVLQRGDVLMLCSDGLSGMVRDADISQTLRRLPDPAESCRVLIEDANQAGGHDNVTVIVAQFDGEGLPVPNEATIGALKYAKYKLPSWVDDRASRASRVSVLGGAGRDDAPTIEITGEFEVNEGLEWEEPLEDRPSIPKEQGPRISSLVIVLAVIGIMIAGYYLIAVR